MPVEWIMAFGVLLVAGAILCVVVRRYERREPDPGEMKRAELPAYLAEGASNFEECNPTPLPEDKPPFDIPVLRDKPKPRISASDVDPTSGLDPDFNWDGKDK